MQCCCCFFFVFFFVIYLFYFIFFFFHFSGGDASLPDILQEAPVDVLTNRECQDYWGRDSITDGHVCIFDKPGGGSEGDIGACNVSYEQNTE